MAAIASLAAWRKAARNSGWSSAISRVGMGGERAKSRRKEERVRAARNECGGKSNE
jgi:hypothetical protein